MKQKLYLLLIGMLLISLAACGVTPGSEPAAGGDSPVSGDPLPSPTPATGAENVVMGEAAVESVQVAILESFPVQVSVQVSGFLGDGCTELGPIDAEREEDTFYVTIQTSRPAEAICTQQLTTFEESIPLDVNGLEAGTYTVDVNGVTSSFTLDVDNGLVDPDEDGPETADWDTLSPADQRTLIKRSLELALVDQEIPDYGLIEDKENIVLSTEHLTADLVPTLPGIQLILLTPAEIQARANAEGDFLYLVFDDIRVESTAKVSISLNNVWAIAEDSDMLYLSGGGFTIEYTKTANEWQGEITTMWIS